MNKTQINKLRMYEAVDLVLSNHALRFAQLEDLVSGHQRLQVQIQQIGQYRQVQETDNSGLTEVKVDLKTNLLNKVLQLSAALKSYANSTNDKELKAKADYTKSELSQSSDPVLFDIGTLLLNLANPLQTQLSKYFVSPAKLQEMSNLLTEFNASIPQKRVAISVSKVSTGNISDVFNSASKMLKDELDVLMLLFEETEPDFYKAYKNARSIIGYIGRGKIEPEAVVPV